MPGIIEANPSTKKFDRSIFTDMGGVGNAAVPPAEE